MKPDGRTSSSSMSWFSNPISGPDDNRCSSCSDCSPVSYGDGIVSYDEHGNIVPGRRRCSCCECCCRKRKDSYLNPSTYPSNREVYNRDGFNWC